MRDIIRKFFQPGRVLFMSYICPDMSLNTIVISFNMWSSYDPIMMTLAIECNSYTFQVLDQVRLFVLSIPGPKLARAAIRCGTTSKKECNNKLETFRICHHLTDDGFLHLDEAILNIDSSVVDIIQPGDHKLLTLKLLKCSVGNETAKRCLLTCRASTEGINIIEHDVDHNIGILKHNQAEYNKEG